MSSVDDSVTLPVDDSVTLPVDEPVNTSVDEPVVTPSEPPKMVIKNEKEVTSEFILKEANDIWERFMIANIPREDTEHNDDYFNKTAKDHPEFFYSYPLVLRHMINDYSYHPDAFAQYLNQLSKKMWTNDSERMDAYTDYAVYLYKALNPLWHKDKLKHFKRDYRKRLQKDHDEFNKIADNASKQFDKEQIQYENERRQEKLAQFEALARKSNIDEKDLNEFKLMFSNKLIKEDKLDELINKLRGW